MRAYLWSLLGFDRLTEVEERYGAYEKKGNYELLEIRHVEQ